MCANLEDMLGNFLALLKWLVGNTNKFILLNKAARIMYNITNIGSH